MKVEIINSILPPLSGEVASQSDDGRVLPPFLIKNLFYFGQLTINPFY